MKMNKNSVEKELIRRIELLENETLYKQDKINQAKIDTYKNCLLIVKYRQVIKCLK